MRTLGVVAGTCWPIAAADRAERARERRGCAGFSRGCRVVTMHRGLQQVSEHHDRGSVGSEVDVDQPCHRDPQADADDQRAKRPCACDECQRHAAAAAHAGISMRPEVIEGLDAVGALEIRGKERVPIHGRGPFSRLSAQWHLHDRGSPELL